MGENKLGMKLGCKAKDKVTGFQGIITAEVKYLYGCHQFCILPPAKDDELKEGKWFDEGRIEIIGPGILANEVRGETPGGVVPKTQTPPRSH